jgi:hypothetical protein
VKGTGEKVTEEKKSGGKEMKVQEQGEKDQD